MVTWISDEQRAVNEAGAARCREVVNAIVARRTAARPTPEPKTMTRADEIHQRALERAIGERRNTRLAFVRGATA